tara:strand:+ start:96 stop:575 length:480 start_codon:yes stop_codon:yes gene_type:complete
MKELMMKAKIMEELLINWKSIDYLNNVKHLNIYSLLGNVLSLDDWNQLQQQKIYFNVVFSPGVVSPIEKEISVGSQIINIEYNLLMQLSQKQRVAIVLHEIGHALNPIIKGQEGEFVADDYAIDRGYGEEIRESLNYLIDKLPKEFDKPINHNRIDRIN